MYQNQTKSKPIEGSFISLQVKHRMQRNSGLILSSNNYPKNRGVLLNTSIITKLSETWLYHSVCNNSLFRAAEWYRQLTIRFCEGRRHTNIIHIRTE